MTRFPGIHAAPSIQPYADALAAEHKDALKTSAPRALTDLLASAMAAMADLEESHQGESPSRLPSAKQKGT